MDTIFKDLVIVELASVLAGPAVGMFFAELGAKVIKIENASTQGDVTRTWKIAGEEGEGPAAYYHSINYHKEVRFLDLKNELDQESTVALIQQADIVISNFSDHVSEKLGVAYAKIKSIHPKVIFAQLYGFESDRTRPAYDIVLQAESGFLSMTGLSNEALCRMPVALIDILAAHQLKEGILIALIKKLKNGVGSYISTSLEECAIASLANQATNYLMVDHIPSPLGTIHPNIAPYGDIFMTADNIRIVLAIGSNGQFAKLCSLLGHASLATDPRFADNKERVNNRTHLVQELQALISDCSSTSLFEDCHKQKVPIGKIKNLKEVFQSKVGQSLILSQKESDNTISKRVKTVAFKIE